MAIARLTAPCCKGYFARYIPADTLCQKIRMEFEQEGSLAAAPSHTSGTRPETYSGVAIVYLPP